MARQVATPRQTAGAGFAYEDKFAACLLVQLLSASSPLPLDHGHIKRIKFQARHLGWLLDDVLLTLDDGTVERYCAISVKSTAQVTAASVPDDFVSDAWGTYLGVQGAPFQQDRDFLVLACPPHPTTVSAAFHSVITKARTHNPAEIENELSVSGYASQVERALFRSLGPPKGMVPDGASLGLTGKFVSSVRFLEFDLDGEPPRDVIITLERCRRLLTAATREEAVSLWERLLAVASEYRTAGGELDLAGLRTALGDQFELEDYPEYKADWRRLREHTAASLLQIPDKIGGVINLPRESLTREAEAVLHEHQVCVLLGESGTGKTVVAKCLAERIANSHDVIWIDASRDTSAGPEGFRHKLGLVHTWEDLCTGAAANQVLVVVDGPDRIFEREGLGRLAAVLAAIDFQNVAPNWNLLVACSSTEWSRIQGEMMRFDLSADRWHTVEVVGFADEEIREICRRIPSLGVVASRPELLPIVAKPKILDLIALRVAVGDLPDTRRWVGESDLVNWFWESEVLGLPGGVAEDAFLMKLAARQADSLRNEVPSNEFDAAELGAADRLFKRRFCQEDGGRISFGHDLLGDWARLRCLTMNEDELVSYLADRKDSVLWHRALRLYGLDWIERRQDPEGWSHILSMFRQRGEPFAVVADQFLDALFIAADSEIVLERAWAQLHASEGMLLRRLLTRFLHVATVPNPRYAFFAEAADLDMRSLAVTMDRVPVLLLWFGMLRFLTAHRLDVAKYAIQPAARIALSWLANTPSPYLRREEAGQLALACFERVVAEERAHLYRVDEEYAKLAYRAGLASIGEFPSEVGKLARRAVGREDDGKTEGPGCRVDGAFREVCVETDALGPVMRQDPELASELIMAVLLRQSDERQGRSTGFDRVHYDFEIERSGRDFPPFYTKGPFLSFLQIDPYAGLGVIIRLVNFVTERWADVVREGGAEVPALDVPDVNDRHRWIGDSQVYFWYRQGNVPDIVVSALMALEKWLYMRDEAADDVSKYVDGVLRGGRSAALLAVLVALGKTNTRLFLGSLKPLMGVPEIHDWEQQHSIAGEDFQMMGWTSAFGRPNPLIQMAKEWHSMPIRRVDLRRGWLQLFVLSDEYRQAFRRFRQVWIQRLENYSPGDDERGFLETLIAQYDEENWQRVSTSDGEGWQFDPPPALAARAERLSQELESRHLFTVLLEFPLFRGQVNIGQLMLRLHDTAVHS